MRGTRFVCAFRGSATLDCRSFGRSPTRKGVPRQRCARAFACASPTRRWPTTSASPARAASTRTGSISRRSTSAAPATSCSTRTRTVRRPRGTTRPPGACSSRSPSGCWTCRRRRYAELGELEPVEPDGVIRLVPGKHLLDRRLFLARQHHLVDPVEVHADALAVVLERLRDHRLQLVADPSRVG